MRTNFEDYKIAWSKDKAGRLVASLVTPGGGVVSQWVAERVAE
jgi:hypothetical protein